MTPSELLQQFGPRENMSYDVVIVGAGPAGLATAIRLKQIQPDFSVVVLEKGSEPGAHILSGAVMDPRAITELFSDWKALGAPLLQSVTRDEVLILGPQGHRQIPQWLVPDCLHNEGNYIISLGAVVQWLAQQAEALGVEIFAGFTAAEILYSADGSVRGVATGHVGLGKDGQPTDHFALGMELLGRYTVFAEGSRGHLGKQVIQRFALDEGRDPQSYALGVKEMWQVDPQRAQAGLVIHTAGWPMDEHTYGGGFLYHMADNRVSLGFVTGLDYQNPWISPFEEMQRWKTHPAIRCHLEGATRVGYGARAITAGGLLSLPKLSFPGGVLVGCDAGTLNAARIKGSHTALKSGMLAAESLAQALAQGRQGDTVQDYESAFQASWAYSELHRSRNFKQWFKKGNTVGTVMTGVEQWLLPRMGVASPPWTIRRAEPDHVRLHAASQVERIEYPKPDGALTFDRLSSVYISNTNHEEDQPAHLTLKSDAVPVAVNWHRFAGPEARYCPAGVYEYVASAPTDTPHLVINAQNCVHCKTCDIKDPTQNIVWVTPEGSGGPNYAGM